MPGNCGNGRKMSLSGVPYIPWKNMHFERLTFKENRKNKKVAKCLVCNEILQNTGYKRFERHSYVNSIKKLLFLLVICYYLY